MADLEIGAESPPNIQAVSYVPPALQIVAAAPPAVQLLQAPALVLQVGLSHPTESNVPATEVITIPFAYGDATPKTIATIAAGQTVFTVQIVIQVPFNGIGAALALGDDDQGDRLMAVGQNDPLLAAEYETNPAYSYSAATPILLSITPGEGCTQGSGYVLLEV